MGLELAHPASSELACQAWPSFISGSYLSPDDNSPRPRLNASDTIAHPGDPRPSAGIFYAERVAKGSRSLRGSGPGRA
jgi:hypothetical protein